METMAAPRLSISILVVEDEVITLEYLVTTLAKKFPNVTLHRATNGRMGLELFKTHMPDIVITDINMPDMGGVQMAEQIHAIKPDTKFIVLTGDSEKHKLEDSIENGFEIDHYIVKPVFFQELFTVVEQCME
ncbi:MAG: response regulator [Desulfatirhabdiaceae bacterium]